MGRTATYSIFIFRIENGYQAYSPAFPSFTAKSHSLRAAYARIKSHIKQQLNEHLAKGEPIPRDPVYQTRTLRIDLWLLSMRGDLV